ncbi:hypothetical protein ACHAQA_006340 [Verticillium albo-atrum]
MPSSVLDGLSLINVGPLTTTYTAGAACATDFGFSGAAREIWPDFSWVGTGNCKDDFDSAVDCLPLGEERDEFWSSVVTATVSASAEQRYLVPYYSPGYHCPSGWETAGVAAMVNGTASITGAFSPVFTATADNGDVVTTDFPTQNFIANVFTSALEPQETAVLCCPSGYTMGVREPNCYSNFPRTELAGSTGCARELVPSTSGAEIPELTDMPRSTTVTWVWQGTTTSQVQPVWAPYPTEGLKTVTSTFTFDEEGRPSGAGHDGTDDFYIGVKGTSAIILFNEGPAETSGTAPPSSSSSGAPSNSSDTDGGSDDDAENVDESAGSALRPTSMWGAVGGMMVVWTVGALAGAGLIAAL